MGCEINSREMGLAGEIKEMGRVEELQENEEFEAMEPTFKQEDSDSNLCHVYFLQIIKAYKQFIVDVGKLLGGDDDIEKEAEELVAFERELANVRLLPPYACAV